MSTAATPHGAWPSPLTGAGVAGKTLRFGDVSALDGWLYWTESRAEEAGRMTVMRGRPGEEAVSILEAPFSARSRVHEYGGGALATGAGKVFFVNNEDQDFYRLEADGPARVTESDYRFADAAVAPDGDFLIAVAEAHGDAHHPANLLARIELSTNPATVTPVAEGRDFFAAPRLSPDGTQIAWLAWDLPFMPWQSAELWLADVTATGLANARRLAGGVDQAAFQPAWSPDGVLHAVLDAPGGSAFLRFDDGTHTVVESRGEWLRPLWGLGTASLAFADAATVAVSRQTGGSDVLSLCDLGTGALRDLDCGLAGISQPVLLDGSVCVLASRHEAPPAIVAVDPDSPATPTVIRSSGAPPLGAGDVSVGQPMTFGEAAPVHALHYPPANARHRAPDGELPPMIVSAHGGPTGHADRGLNLRVQYWTSRGFAFLDVDYRGSAGYGQAYRKALDGHWGIMDADDVESAALGAVEQGLADGDRLLISGRSAGGYTVLQALVRSDIFAAGTSTYGIGDLDLLLRTTHKFEAGYLDTLLGLTEENRDAVLAARSPCRHAEKITAPALFLQGADDMVVPPSQSRDMFAMLEVRGIPTAYMEFAGEGHGFRRAETIEAALQAEYGFYCAVLGIAPPEPLPALDIRNRSALAK